MNEQLALLRSILDTPDDDTPRVVYADWLEEHDQSERAEFIRLQCALAQRFRERSYVADDALLMTQWERQNELLRTYRATWLNELPPWVGVQYFRRGFISSIQVTAAQWIDQGNALEQMTPLDTVMFLQSPRYFSTLVHEPSLHRLAGLNFTNNGLSVQHVLYLSRTHEWPRLRSLSLAGNLLTTAAATVLANASWMSELEYLDLSFNPLSDQSVIELARSPRVTRLRALQLLGTRISDRAVQAVLDSPYLKRLDWFRVGEGISADVRREVESRFPSTGFF